MGNQATKRTILVTALLLAGQQPGIADFFAGGRSEPGAAPENSGTSGSAHLRAAESKSEAGIHVDSVAAGGAGESQVEATDAAPAPNVSSGSGRVVGGAAGDAADPSSKESAGSSGQVPRVGKWRPGQELSISTNTEDLVPTDDVELARKQVTAYPDSPEASFILAVALTRTSQVEEALKEVKRAKKLAESKGGAAYFDKMIQTYEEMLVNYPKENRVRYGLAWAYYMKAYLLANHSRKVAAWKAVNGDPLDALKAGKGPGTSGSATIQPIPAGATDASQENAVTSAPLLPGLSNKLDIAKVATALAVVAQGSTPAADALPKIPSMLDKIDPADLPEIRRYYDLALRKLDDLIAQRPDDVWALVYRAHLKAEYTGNLSEAMKTWASCRDRFANNPAPYFFLGEGYMKQGNLKESITNVSRAVALRAMGF